ncbi:MAG: hypothetical protein V4726_17780 [Verrucomicrobiota bacterium]
MITTPAEDILAEVWAAKDKLSARFGHNLHATCLALYAEQEKNPKQFVNLGGGLVTKTGRESSRQSSQAKP